MKKNKSKVDPRILELVENIDGQSLEDLNDIIKQIKKSFIEKALKQEMSEHLGYEKWDQNSRDKSDNYRNGISKKIVKSNSGNIELEIPRDTNSNFEPRIVKKYQNDISSFDDKIISMYAKGMSSRDISEHINDIYGVDVSKDFISKVTDKIIPDIIAWQSRQLNQYYPILFIDGMRFKVKDEGIYKEKSVYIIIGINELGLKEILGFWVSESESSKQWMNIFSEIKNRGTLKINIISCDNLKGISDAIKTIYPETDVQKCIVHQIRNSMRFVYHKDMKEFASDMKKIYTAPNIENANTALDLFDEKWSSKYKYAIKSWRENFSELTTFFNYPHNVRKIIYTTNPIENLNRNIRKLTKTKGGITTTKALEKLVYLAIQQQSKKWTIRIVDWGNVYQQLKDIFGE